MQSQHDKCSTHAATAHQNNIQRFSAKCFNILVTSFASTSLSAAPFSFSTSLPSINPSILSRCYHPPYSRCPTNPMIEEPNPPGVRSRPRPIPTSSSPSSPIPHPLETPPPQPNHASTTATTIRKLIPEAYRQRVAVAMVLLLVAILVRFGMGRRLPTTWLLHGVHYSRTGEDGGAAFDLHISPFPVWCAIYALVQFMLRRPGRR